MVKPGKLRFGIQDRVSLQKMCYLANRHMTPALAPSPSVIHTALTDGQPVCLRRITPADGELMRAGIAQMSARSRYLRFFFGDADPA